MKKALLQSLVIASCVALVSSAAYAKKNASGYGSYERTLTWSETMSLDNPAAVTKRGNLNASAAVTTVVLNSSKFDLGASCTANSWTTEDITKQTGDWWHVDDFTTAPWAGTQSTGGITFNAITGSRSMWMAAVPPTGGPVNTILCGYAALPGYGNGWNQAFCSKACLATSGGPTADLDVKFSLKFDSEPSYDGTILEYTTDCAGNIGWTEIDGGATPAGWSGPDSISIDSSYVVGAGPVKVRLHFTADTAWSNQDGFYPGFGVAIDNLSWEGLPVEGFETTALGSNSSTDWQSCNTPGFGNYLGLFKRVDANYEDICLQNLGCYWAAIQGSTEFYTCGVPSQPGQKVVPHVNVRGEYLSNEVWSPSLSLSGSSGSDFRLRYTVYQDLPLDNLIFHVWHVRTIDTAGCPGAWADRNFVYYGDGKNWQINENLIGSKVNVATGAAIQVAIGVIDMCPFWCGVIGSGLCHSPAPYLDSVKVLRIDTVGPQWDVRTLETFQDNFSADGTTTGTARVDEANDIKPSASPSYTPGDSAIVLYLLDPASIGGAVTTISGLSNDPNVSTFVGRHKTKNAVYGYFTVTPFDAAKIGPGISDGPGGQANRYPYIGSIVANGKTWAQVRMDYTYTGTATNPGDGHPAPNAPAFVANRFNIDINDNLFTPGDTIEYFYGATSPAGTTYWSAAWGATSSLADISANPMEATILPAGGYNRGGDILYVDGADGFGVQPYYDGAFLALGIASKVDRYDVNAPSSAVANRLGGRVQNVAAQLNACYKKIVWDSGLLSITLGDGTGNPEKTDDYAMMNAFCDNMTPANFGGVMLLGDRQPQYLNILVGSAVPFRSNYMPFTLTSDDYLDYHGGSGSNISPKVMAWPGRAYTVQAGDNNFTLNGGCPALNDFDVMAASGTSRIEMSYDTASGPEGAVVSNVHVNGNGASVTVIQTGFSLAYVRDDESDGVSDRAKFLRDSFVYMGNPFGTTTNAGGPALKNSLSQNYPNPFNPQTTIAFTIKDRGAVTLKVYNVNGELVRTLVNTDRAAGTYTEKWNGLNDAGQTVSSGVYFYKLVTNNFSQTKKMVLLK